MTSAEAWPRLARLSPTEGRLGQEVKALALAAEALNGEVPILQTVFSPLTTAVKLAGDRVFADLRRHPDLFEAGLASSPRPRSPSPAPACAPARMGCSSPPSAPATAC